jgi:hypothetical protein
MGSEPMGVGRHRRDKVLGLVSVRQIHDVEVGQGRIQSISPVSSGLPRLLLLVIVRLLDGFLLAFLLNGFPLPIHLRLSPPHWLYQPPHYQHHQPSHEPSSPNNSTSSTSTCTSSNASRRSPNSLNSLTQLQLPRFSSCYWVCEGGRGRSAMLGSSPSPSPSLSLDNCDGAVS